jgi:hypothetical protein
MVPKVVSVRGYDWRLTNQVQVEIKGVVTERRRGEEFEPQCIALQLIAHEHEDILLPFRSQIVFFILELEGSQSSSPPLHSAKRLC